MSSPDSHRSSEAPAHSQIFFGGLLVLVLGAVAWLLLVC